MKSLQQRLAAYVARIHAVVVNAMHRCEVLKNHARSVCQFHIDVVSFVAALLCMSRPPTISAFVMAIHANAIKRFASRALTHIGEKNREVIPPLGRDLDPATAVTGEPLVFGVLASIDSVAPCAVAACQPANARPVAKLNFANRLAESAATALCVTRSQFLRLNYRLVAAVAAATPSRVVELVRHIARNRHQSAESLAGNFNSFHGCQLYMEIR